MTTHPIVAEVLGHASEAALSRELSNMTDLLRRCTEADWVRPTAAADVHVAAVVAHLGAGATRLANAWRRRLDPEPSPLQHPIHDPGIDVELVTDDRDRLVRAYTDAVEDLRAALGTCKTDDWSWPVWSPLGGTETLASAARRWIAHHRVHHHDIAAALGTRPADDERTDQLVSEFVLDALARRGGPAVAAPARFEVVVDPPGAGTWTIIADAEPSPDDLPPIWYEIVAPPERRDRFRVERGAADRGEVIVRTDGETLWRAAFRRGASWNELTVHGSDEGKQRWRSLVTTLASEATSIGQVQG